jgi:hypothetical protein
VLSDGFVWQIYVESKQAIDSYIEKNNAFPEPVTAASSTSFNPSPPKELTAQ